TTFGQPKLKESSEGVRLLQSFLKKTKHYVGSEDGNMSPRTLVAIRKYQKSKNIKVTGKLDELTRGAMIDDIARSL
ncbi:peptidoglycan-binding protein, partial [Candidatus Gracilibacteria bacterium]|nr:peptidoglycan-binding protein [Candidatus Gracilibacteria bacterium]